MPRSCAALELGRNARVHTTRILHLSSDLPILIEAVEQGSVFLGRLPKLDAMVGEGLITLERVEVIAYRSPDKKVVRLLIAATGFMPALCLVLLVGTSVPQRRGVGGRLAARGDSSSVSPR